MRKKYRARYKGRGFVPGVPARDLTAEEVERYGVGFLQRGRLWELVEVEAEGAQAGGRQVDEEDSDG